MLSFVKSGNKELMESGSVIVDSDNFTLGITLFDSRQINTHVSFIKDEDLIDSRYEFKWLGGNEISLDLINTSELIGASGPINYASHGNVQTYILVSWIGLGGGLRKIDYTIYKDYKLNDTN